MSGNGSDHLELLNREVRNHAERLSSVESHLPRIGELEGRQITAEAAVLQFSRGQADIRDTLVSLAGRIRELSEVVQRLVSATERP